MIRPTSVLALLLLANVGCPGDGGARPNPPSVQKLCPQTTPETYGVVPFGNKTKAPLALAGGSDLLAASMEGSGCFRLIERERLDALIGEMKLCSDQNPDRAYMNCESFAKQGQILGLQRMVMADVVFFEPNVKGGELAVKIPGLPLAGLELGRSYAALSLSVRVVDVETAQIKGTAIVHALLPADKLDVGVSGGGFNLSASVRNKSPFGEELQAMLGRATVDLAAQIGSRP